MNPIICSIWEGTPLCTLTSTLSSSLPSTTTSVSCRGSATNCLTSTIICCRAQPPRTIPAPVQSQRSCFRLKWDRDQQPLKWWLRGDDVTPLSVNTHLSIIRYGVLLICFLSRLFWHLNTESTRKHPRGVGEWLEGGSQSSVSATGWRNKHTQPP